MLTVRIYTSIIHLARAREYALLDDDDDGECACAARQRRYWRALIDTASHTLGVFLVRECA